MWLFIKRLNGSFPVLICDILLLLVLGNLKDYDICKFSEEVGDKMALPPQPTSVGFRKFLILIYIDITNP